MGKPIPVHLVSPHHIYFDDSGCNAKWSPTLIWAGYAAPLGFWEKFGDRWNEILDRRPRIPFWHQTDVRATSRKDTPRNPFYGYSQTVLSRREDALCELLHDNRRMMWAIAVKLRHDHVVRYVSKKIDNPTWTPAEREFVCPKVMESPHLLALIYALRMCEVIHSKKPEHRMPVSFHCENRQDDQFQPKLAHAWEIIRKHHPTADKDLGVLSFVEAKSRNAPQVQAADMLAWHINKRARRPKEPEDHKWKYVKGRKLIQDTIPVDTLKKHVRLWASYRSS